MARVHYTFKKIVLGLPLFFLAFLSFTSCTRNKEKKAIALYNDYCASCHIAPSIQALPKHLWAEQVLPEMGARMGVRDSSYSPYKGLPFDEYEAVLKTGLFTLAPIIGKEEWDLLKEYIIQQAPDSLSMPHKEIANKRLNGFAPKPISFDLINNTKFTYLNADRDDGTVKLGDMKGRLFTYDFIQDSLIFNGNFSRPITAYNNKKDMEYITAVGNLNPSELASGKIFRVKDRKVKAIPEIFHRPVHTVVQDLNNDGIDEIMVSEFGHLTGKLTLLSPIDDITYDRQVLLNQPGVIRVVVKDMNNDQLHDLVVLTSQADESITILYQENDLKFRAEKVLRFSPIYGSSWFELIDFDKDGDYDIVTVHGDNADKTYTPKPYHGMRLHINDGNNNYEEKYFYPMNGATRIISRDFDKDGDFDFGLLSTFPDYENANEPSFIYLENKSTDPIRFEEFSFKESNFARWLLMDAGDVDGDGDEDIILSAFPYALTPVPEEQSNFWKEKSTDLMVLENNLN
ncbi:MAG: VCBS repeat-containing protein [Maribacter sp.]|nr:VCBS repeat-containing protein [Maribacter sp.]